MNRLLRRSILLALVVSVYSACAAVKKPTVCVQAFKSTGGENCTATEADIRALETKIEGNIISCGKYTVVERKRLAEVQSELSLVDAGLTEGQAPESNRLKAAGYVIYGTIGEYRSSLQQVQEGSMTICSATARIGIQIRIADITSGAILHSREVTSEGKGRVVATGAVATDKNARQEALIDAIGKAAADIVLALNSVAYPVYVVDADSEWVVGNVSDALVVQDELWEVWKRGRAIRDPDTEEIIGYKESLVCSVRVARPGPKMTKFKYVDAGKAPEIEALLEDEKKLELRKATKTQSEKPSRRRKLLECED